MEKKFLKLLFGICLFSVAFLFKGNRVRETLVVFFAKGVLANLLDAYVVGTKRIEYPVRPLPKIFKTNLIYDILFFPLLSVIWVKRSYNDSLRIIFLKSLIISVPMSIAQWYLEKNTRLFTWKKWSIYHTFGTTSFTLLTIRGLVGLIKKLDLIKSNQSTTE